MNRSEENTKIIHNQLPLEIKRLVDLAKEREALTLSDNDFHLIKESSLCLYTQPHRESLTEKVQMVHGSRLGILTRGFWNVRQDFFFDVLLRVHIPPKCSLGTDPETYRPAVYK